MKKIVFFLGESGSGKTHLQELLLKNWPDKFTRIISTTSREPREGEVDGEHYHFVDDKDFMHLIGKDELLQYVRFGGKHYGTQFKEYSQEQDIGTFVCTPEGVWDTINALNECNIEKEFQVVMFLTTDNKLKEHGTPEERIQRGKIREDFLKRYMANEYDGLNLIILTDIAINANIHTTMEKLL